MLPAYLLSALCLLAFLIALFQYITYAQPSVSRMPDQGAEGPRLGMFKQAVCSRLSGSSWGYS